MFILSDTCCINHGLPGAGSPWFFDTNKHMLRIQILYVER